MKNPTLAPADHAKLLIAEMTATDIESVIAYAKFWLHQLKRKEKKAAKKPSTERDSALADPDREPELPGNSR